MWLRKPSAAFERRRDAAANRRIPPTMLRHWRYDVEEEWVGARTPLEYALAEGFELLRWSVLAASTIGPGTVIVCSKAGYNYGLRLLWPLVLASGVAYRRRAELGETKPVRAGSAGAALVPTLENRTRTHVIASRRYALQEGAARLSIADRTTLGGAMRTLWRDPKRPTATPKRCSAVALGVLVGNAAYFRRAELPKASRGDAAAAT